MKSLRESYEKNLIKQCFQDKNIFLQCIEKVPSEKLFQNTLMRLFWQVFTMIYGEGQDLHKSVIKDVLTTTNNEELIASFKEIIEGTYDDEDQWEYHLSYLIEQLRKELLLNISNGIRKEIGEKSSEELLGSVNKQIVELNSTEIKTVSFKQAFNDTIKNIKNIASGKEISLLRTGHVQFDELVSMGKKAILMIASQKKVGKTRFIVHLIDKLINNNQADLDVQWYSFEMQSDEMIRLFISKKIGLNDKQLMSINYKLTTDEILRIEAGYQYFNNFPIEFVDETANIFNICARFERFADGVKGKIPICVIDNLGLIKPHQKSDLQNEDDIARMLKDLRDKTGGLIIVLHHLSKESESKFNVTEMYRPKVTHIRGSSRLVDFANKVILLHRPEMYSDVVKHYAKAGKDHLIQNLFEVNCALNRSGETGMIDFKHQLEFSNFQEI